MTEKLKELIKQFEEENNIIQRDITHLNNKVVEKEHDLHEEVRQFFIDNMFQYRDILRQFNIKDLCISKLNYKMTFHSDVGQVLTLCIFLDGTYYTFTFYKDNKMMSPLDTNLNIKGSNYILSHKEEIISVIEKGIEEKLIEKHKKLLEKNKDLLDSLEK